MKKILFTILAVAAMSAACTKFVEDTAPTYDAAPKPEVTGTVVSDTEITVTITAGEGSNFWGYAVLTGTPGASADKLVANGYAKDAAVVLQGEDKLPQAAQMKYSEETKTVTLELTGLTPYTDYTVYAAAVTEMGVVSEVAELTLKTTDGTAPVVTDFDFSEEEEILTFAIAFNDPVQLTGNGTATAWFYGENYYDESGMLILYKEVAIPTDHIAASGKNLIVSVPASEYIPGAYVAITYSADIVKNGADAVNAAYETHLIGYGEEGIEKQGIFGYYDYANWDFSLVDPATLPDEEEGSGDMEGEDEEEEEVKVPVYFGDWTKLIMTVYSTSEYDLADTTGDDEITIISTEANGRTVSYTASKYGVLTANTAGIMLSEAPAYGSTISFTVAEGSFCDIFGNVNNEFKAEDEYYRSYGYTLNDILGSYTIQAVSAFDKSLITKSMVIEASDDPEAGDFMITSFAGIPCNIAPIYGSFDTDSGSIDIYGNQPFYGYIDDADTPEDESDDVQVAYVFYTYEYEWLNLTMPESGVIAGPNDMFGVVIANNGQLSGWGYLFADFEATKVESPAPAAMKRFSKKDLVKFEAVEKK